MKKQSTEWNLSKLFDSDNDRKILERRQECEEQSYVFINKWKNRTDYLSDPSVLKEALDEYEKWMRNYGTNSTEYYYFELRSHQDMISAALKSSFNQAMDLATKIQNDIQFFTLNLGNIPHDKQEVFLREQSLQDYHHYLEILFKRAKYQLPEAEEKIINLKRQSSNDNWIKMVRGFISKEERAVLLENGETEKKCFADLGSLLASQSKEVRDSAAKAINEILSTHVPLAEQELNSILANKKVDDELKHFPRPDSDSHLTDDVDTEIVDKLISEVANKFSVSRRWYELKAKLLGLSKLEYHERMVEYGQINTKYSFDDSCRLVSSVFSKLDPVFGKIFDDFVKEGQIDIYPAKGKYGGAFCASTLITLPTYLLLNHTDKFQDVCTLAHEGGHGINNELMKINQNAINYGSPLSTAEVASTFMEDFVIREVMDGADDELRLIMMIQKLDNDVATIFRQAACYLFEQELHEVFRKTGYVSKETIGSLFQKHMSDYMGSAVLQSPGSENWWVHWPHIRSFFYVYSYVSGLLISKSLQRSVRSDHKYIDLVKKFLSAGSSESPKDIFTKLGIDISDSNFWKSGIQEVEDLMTEIELLATKLGKLS